VWKREKKRNEKKVLLLPAGNLNTTVPIEKRSMGGTGEGKYLNRRKRGRD